jgi:hypothetical protein
MTKQRIFRIVLVIAVISLSLSGGLFGGVRQMRSANSTGTQTYVNPNYSNQATTFRQQTGNISVNPGRAISGQAGTAVYNGYGAVVASGYYYDYGTWTDTAPQPDSGIPIGTILEYAPSSAVPVMVEGTRYYYENNIYLAEVFDGTSVVYQVVPAPLGAVVTQLPAGCAVQNYNGRSFQVCGSTYYQQVAGGYQVVASN